MKKPAVQMEIQIETGIPIPKKPHKSKYPWADIDVGQSFVGAKCCAQLASNFGRKLGRKFTTRRIECGNVRVWRTE